MVSGDCWAKSLNTGVAASEVTAEVIEPCAKSSWFEAISMAAGANGPELPVHTTFAPTLASAAARLPSFFPTASTPAFPGSGMRTAMRPVLLLAALLLALLVGVMALVGLLDDELQPAAAAMAAKAAIDAARPRRVVGRIIWGSPVVLRAAAHGPPMWILERGCR